MFGYLSHMGFATTARPVPLWSASATYEQKYGEVAHAMTEAEIAEVTEAFAAAAGLPAAFSCSPVAGEGS